MNKKVEELEIKCNCQPLKLSQNSPQRGRRPVDFTWIIAGDKCKLFEAEIEFLMDLLRECKETEVRYIQSKFDVQTIDQIVRSIENELALQRQPSPDDAVVRKGIYALKQCFALDKYERGLHAKRVASRIPQIVLENDHMVVVTSGSM